MAGRQTVVVGAGPAGLAAAAMLGRRGLTATVLDREPAVGASWRGHYESLRMHTVRSLSTLPGAPLPRAGGRWVARADFVAYLDRYAAENRLVIRPSVDVHRIDAAGAGVMLATSAGTITAAAAVVATGYNREPVLPAWPGQDTFGGRLLHSNAYRTADPYRGQDVLVVGAGNSGTDIALDLARGGARRVWLSLRSPPGLVPRQALGLPAQVAAIGLARAPARLADAVAALERRLFVGDLSARGLQADARGIFTRHRREGRLPILDHGFAAAVRNGQITIVPAVEAIDGPHVDLHGGTRLDPATIIAATGYRPALHALVGHLGVLRPDGLPAVHGARTHPGAPCVHFTGFRNPITGALRELRFEAAAIAEAIAAAEASALVRAQPA
ncbi:MAG TPA: NAD(P)/FAD-dependent oxidoreductase [Gaiellales bacterium]|jgi:cation diffusion facilitator CzcD-associated flavoprotein CzcO